ncbi:urease accessory protein UreD [Agrobacterium sp. rho-13.3]|uniref:urease accessory protein UreD n=1 Tax=Agrobacterium sp. rho-13.3 TaxID=3072980 RepID=UPI002A14F7E9|nr:urease accessory protein UreD [Agrobacterium sp. rho-13.3]MDX8307873.1 urease accessory protein UreD [Agrobacterium sp. rho-13.3]
MQPDQQSIHQPRPQRARGRGRIVTKALNGRSRLDELFQEGCAKIRLPDTFSNEMEAILINSSGGLTGGDELEWQAVAAAGTSLVVTTQACEKVYKASSGTAAVTARVSAGAGAKLHWLPQETILFDRSSLTRRLEADIDASAEFVAVEAVLLGRQAMGEMMEEGLFRDRWRIRHGGKLVHAEELRLDGNVAELTRHAPVLAGQVAFATLLYIGPLSEALLPKVREILGDFGGASEWQGKLVVRLSAPDGFTLRKMLFPIISLLRNGAAVPKVWNL